MQLTPAQERQLEALRVAGYGNTSDIIRIAIDRMYNEENMTMIIAKSDREIIAAAAEEMPSWANNLKIVGDYMIMKCKYNKDLVAAIKKIDKDQRDWNASPYNNQYWIFGPEAHGQARQLFNQYYGAEVVERYSAVSAPTTHEAIANEPVANQDDTITSLIEQGLVGGFPSAMGDGDNAAGHAIAEERERAKHARFCWDCGSEMEHDQGGWYCEHCDG